MHMLLNKWRLDTSLNALVHIETGEIQRLGEFHYILLETLVNHAGEVLSRNFLINAVWKNRVVGNNSLPTAIYALRAALGDDGRLQEIIKTVPKKGYVFNKDFITYLEDTSLSEAVTESPTAATLPGLPLAPPSGRLRSAIYCKKYIVIFSTIIILLGLMLALYYAFKKESQISKMSPVHEALSIKDETIKNYPRIRISHLHAGNTPVHAAQLKKHIPDTLTAINLLLQQQQMSANIYYSESVSKLSISIIIDGGCHHQYQLMLGIQNWQADTKSLNSAIYQAFEKTIHEIPACE